MFENNGKLTQQIENLKYVNYQIYSNIEIQNMNKINLKMNIKRLLPFLNKFKMNLNKKIKFNLKKLKNYVFFKINVKILKV